MPNTSWFWLLSRQFSCYRDQSREQEGDNKTNTTSIGPAGKRRDLHFQRTFWLEWDTKNMALMIEIIYFWSFWLLIKRRKGRDECNSNGEKPQQRAYGSHEIWWPKLPDLPLKVGQGRASCFKISGNSLKTTFFPFPLPFSSPELQQ